MLEWLQALYKPVVIALTSEVVYAVSMIKGMPYLMNCIVALCWIFGWIIVANGADFLA